MACNECLSPQAGWIHQSVTSELINAAGPSLDHVSIHDQFLVTTFKMQSMSLAPRRYQEDTFTKHYEHSRTISEKSCQQNDKYRTSQSLVLWERAKENLHSLLASLDSCNESSSIADSVTGRNGSELSLLASGPPAVAVTSPARVDWLTPSLVFEAIFMQQNLIHTKPIISNNSYAHDEQGDDPRHKKWGSTVSSTNCDRCWHQRRGIGHATRPGWPLVGAIHSTSQG